LIGTMAQGSSHHAAQRRFHYDPDVELVNQDVVIINPAPLAVLLPQTAWAFACF
jgi:hypothetical protein